MPDSRPFAPDLLTVVQQYLDRDIAPLLPPLHQFQLKIVGRLLDTVRRELQSGSAADAAEHQRLLALLVSDGSLSGQALSGQALSGSEPAPSEPTLSELNALLCKRIRDDEHALADPALRAHLRHTLEDALRINNPKWLGAGRQETAGVAPPRAAAASVAARPGKAE